MADDTGKGQNADPKGAKAQYGKLMGSRNVVLERSRECSDLTLPGLIPRAGMSDNYVLVTPYQSLGARGVNNLASKLLLALFPPNTSYFRLSMDEDVAAKLSQGDPEGKEAIDTALAKLERKICRRIETSNARNIVFEALKLLIVSGNAVLFADKVKNRVFRVDQYVISRDPVGDPLELVIREEVLPQALDEKIRMLCDLAEDSKTTIELFTRVVWKDKKVTYYQEINDIELPDSRGVHPEDKTPWCPLRWQPFANSDYGRGLVDEYLGDLRSLEGISTAIVQFAAAAAGFRAHVDHPVRLGHDIEVVLDHHRGVA